MDRGKRHGPPHYQQCHQAIAAAGPSVKKIADGGGLYLFVKNGRAYWTWQFRNGDRWSSQGFGAFPSVTPKAAREAAEAYRVALRSGTARRLRREPPPSR